MTKRQKEIYSFILEFHEEHGYSPTLNEICKGCYTTAKPYIRETLWKLEEWGFIRWDDSRRRSIVILKRL